MAYKGFETIGRLVPPNQPTSNVFSAYSQPLGSFNEDISGDGTIAGSVKVGTTPVVRLVYLHDKRNMSVVRSAVSASDGSYQFANLKKTLKFLAIAIDNTLTHEPAVADNLTPE